MVDITLALIFVIIGIIVASAIRTVLPFVKKVNQAIKDYKPVPAFNKWYILTMVVSIIIAVFLLLSQAVEIVTNLADTTVFSELAAICLSSGFTLAWTTEDIINRVVSAG